MKKYIELYLKSKTSFCDDIDCSISAMFSAFSKPEEVKSLNDSVYADFFTLLVQINEIYDTINFSDVSQNQKLFKLAFDFGQWLVNKYGINKIEFKRIFFIIKHYKKKHIELIRELKETPEATQNYINILEIIFNSIDLSVYENTEKILTDKFKYRLEWEKLILDISNLFISIPAERIDEEINNTLKNIGNFIGVDRCRIFIFHNNNYDMSNIYEWCGDGIEPQIRQNQKISFKNTPYWLETFEKNMTNVVNNSEELPPEALIEKQILEKTSIKSLISVPMVCLGKKIGFVEFDSVKSHKHWLNEDVVMLKILSEILANTIDRKSRELELKLAKTQADAANIAKTNFLASMSHEIRTPLNSIFGFTDILMKTALDDAQIKYVENIRKSNRVLLSLINDILDFSKIETGRLSIEPAENDLMCILNDIVLICQGEIKEKKLRIVLNVKPIINFNIFCDSVRLKQVLINLVNNAIKFTDSGEITINVILISETKKNAEFEFQVVDNGIGIPAEVQSKIFLPFIQADGTITKKYGGTGLGLSISNNLIELMGGEKITLESQPGFGSKFFFKLNFQKAGVLLENDDYKLTGNSLAHIAISEISNADINNSALNKADETKKDEIQQPVILNVESESKVLQILVVEDNIFNSQLINDILSLSGHNVVIAEDGLGAVEMVQKNNFDVILMDRQLPLLNGCETAKKLRSLGYKNIPIIATTASNSLREKQECIDAGMDSILIKPFDIDLLENFILEVIKNKKKAV